VYGNAPRRPHRSAHVIGDLKLFELITICRLSRYAAEGSNRVGGRPLGLRSMMRPAGYKTSCRAGEHAPETDAVAPAHPHSCWSVDIHGYRSSRAAVCQVMPFCPWVSCGDSAGEADLWGFCGAAGVLDVIASGCRVPDPASDPTAAGGRYLRPFAIGNFMLRDNATLRTVLRQPTCDRADRCSYVCQGLLFIHLENRQDPGFAECGHDRDGPLAVEGRLLSGHEASRLERVPGRPADR
jgi:hypothetical protein